MDYKVKKENEKFIIHENQTNRKVFESKDEKKVRDVARRWNLGGGFAGWTPTFFQTNYDLKPETD